MEIKTNHAFSKRQLISLNNELQKISTAQIIGMRGIKIPSLANFTDIEILKSVYSLDVFLKFMDITNPDHPRSKMYKIETNGSIDYNTRTNLEFNTLADRVSFFNDLEPIIFNY